MYNSFTDVQHTKCIIAVVVCTRLSVMLLYGILYVFVNVRTYRSIIFCLNVQCVYVMYLYDYIMTLYIIIISYYECKYYYHLV